MKNISSVCLLSVLLLAGCSKSSKENDQQAESVTNSEIPVASSGEPITLHARLDFTDLSVSTSVNSSHQLKASIYMEMDVTRDGSGEGATYSQESDSRVQGALFASGKLALNNDDVVSNETYNMHNEWGTLTDKADGIFRMRLPEVSLIGEGLSVGVEIEAPVSGTKKASVSSKGQTVETDVSLSRPIFCSSQSEDKDKDVCKLNFTIDAVPTKARDSAYDSMLESAKALYTYQGKKNSDGGLVMYAGLVPVYGATTEYKDDHFVTALDQQYTVNIDGTDISQHIHLVVWSTKRGEKWQPEGLPPLQKLEEMK